MNQRYNNWNIITYSTNLIILYNFVRTGSIIKFIYSLLRPSHKNIHSIIIDISIEIEQRKV